MHRRTRSATIAAWMLVAALTVAAPSAWAAPAWVAQADLTATGENASVPAVAMNGAGDAVVAWQRASGTGFFAQASLRDAGTIFSTPLELGPAGFEVLGPPQAAIDGAGTAIVVWQQFDAMSTNTVVQAAIRPAGGSFGAPGALSATGSGAVHPQIAMNAAGDALVAWEHLVGQTMVVQAVVRPAGGTFSAPVDLSAAGLMGPLPRVAIDGAGNATVVWTQTGPAGTTVQVATRPAGGTWSAAADLSPAGDASSGQVATNGPGETIAVWTHADAAGNTIVQASVRPVGGAFEASADLSAAGRDAIDPHVAIDAAGHAVAVWSRFDGSTRVVQAASRPAGAAFAAPADLSLAGAEARDPSVVANPAGDIVATWQRSDGADTIVQAAVRRAGTGFGAIIDLSAPGRDAVAPQLGIDADGDAIAAWQRSDGTNTIVQAAGYDAAGPQLRGLNIPVTATRGTAATYSLSPLDVWSPVSSTQWSFDDGTTASGATVSHAFASAGDHSVTVAATDALGNTTSATRVVSVGAPASLDPPPPAAQPPPPPAVCIGDCAVKLPRLVVAIGFDAHVGKRYTVFTKLVVQPAVAGTAIHVRCTGRGCPFKTRTRTVTKSARRLDLTALVRRAKLRRGAQIAVRVTKANTVGASATIGVRDRKRPRRVVRCLFPGDPVPAPCPA